MSRPNDQPASHEADQCASAIVSAAHLFQGMEVAPVAHTFQAGVVMFEQGTAPTHAYRLLVGVVQFVELDSTGQPTLIGHRTDGWPIGIIDALARQPYQYRAQTATACSFNVVATKVLAEALVRSHSLALAALHLQSIEARQRASEARRADNARDKVVRALALAAAISNVSVPRPWLEPRAQDSTSAISQASLAELVGIAPETFSRLRSELERTGILRRHPRRSPTAAHNTPPSSRLDRRSLITPASCK